MNFLTLKYSFNRVLSKNSEMYIIIRGLKKDKIKKMKFGILFHYRTAKEILNFSLIQIIFVISTNMKFVTKNIR